MITWEIHQVKGFMSKLLGSSLLDEFLLLEASLAMGVTHYIDGRRNREFYDEDVISEYCTFQEARDLLFTLIKGKKTPVSFRLSLLLDEGQKEALVATLPKNSYRVLPKHFSLHIRYENGELRLFTGISYETFTMDRDAEQAWDHRVLEMVRDWDSQYGFDAERV